MYMVPKIFTANIFVVYIHKVLIAHVNPCCPLYPQKQYINRKRHILYIWMYVVRHPTVARWFCFTISHWKIFSNTFKNLLQKLQFLSGNFRTSIRFAQPPPLSPAPSSNPPLPPSPPPLFWLCHTQNSPHPPASLSVCITWIWVAVWRLALWRPFCFGAGYTHTLNVHLILINALTQMTPTWISSPSDTNKKKMHLLGPVK